ncbi:XTP/dITP diphosphohydrolase [Tessaracoccus oleiagri]|uniref:XTP/dITP diphosphohydrolase n=2 Tax=Tessaracoccus oleiagri TaxID=686624 RepID=A0A1G9JVS8_9ACTN|nr:XTP/dITP diphosphohydrolase [Tessaracoccus oleiagri]
MTDNQLERLRQVMAQLRADCPWDAEQTHESLLNHLIEEACEVVDAVEAGTDDDLREELGDVLLQVYFHAQIATEEGRFTLDDVAATVSDKLVRRHPHVFGDEQVPADMWANWEQRKAAEKGRRSALDGIAESMSAIARAHKVVSRSRSHGVPVELPSEPIDEETVGEQILALVARAQASGIDADAATRKALRRLESTVQAAER